MENKQISFFTHEFEDHEIRVVGDGRFSVYDVLVAFLEPTVRKRQKGLAINPRQILKTLSERYPEEIESTYAKFPGRGQRNTPVATGEMCEKILMMVNAHPSQTAVTSDRYFPRTEHQIISVLTKAFADLQPIPQFRVHGYRVDLYLASANIAIEVDEHGHNAYSSKAEAKREKAIKSALGCSFVRFDPYAVGFNLGDVILKIRGLI